MAFLVDQVKPMIDARYRTRTGKGDTLVGGSSMGGLISCMLGWAYPETFGAVLCFSPAFSIEGRADWSGFFTGSGPARRDVFFYIDNGGIGLEEELQPGIDRMLAFLEGRGYVRGEDFVFVLDRDARHFEAAWAERFPGAIVTAFERLRGR
jgi:predicted alpha/beta superfamily hydrolase